LHPIIKEKDFNILHYCCRERVRRGTPQRGRRKKENAEKENLFEKNQRKAISRTYFI